MCELPCSVDEIVITIVLCFLLKWLCCWYIEPMTYLLISSLLEGFQLTEGGLPLSPPQMPFCVVGRLGRGIKESALRDDGKGKETKRPPFPFFHRPRALVIFRLLLSILIGIIPSGNLGGGEMDCPSHSSHGCLDGRHPRLRLSLLVLSNQRDLKVSGALDN